MRRSKRYQVFLLFLCPLLLSLTMSCSPRPSEDKPDIDLSILEGLTAFGAAQNLCNNPELYLGKTVRVKGSFTYSGSASSVYYFWVVVQDPSGCCSPVGIEFMLPSKSQDLASYPADHSEVTVTGTYGSYPEGGRTYYYLADATLSS